MIINAADLFCGAGGTSTGLLQAAEEMNRRVNLLAINHWPTAIATHSLNHPDVRHLCESLDHVDPHKAIPGRLHLLAASPECTHHSIARGGKPRSDQSRASAWQVVRWAEAKQPDAILVEPFLIKFYGSGQNVCSVGEPLDTITTRDRFGLAMPQVEIEGEKYVLDIRFRMLQPHELSAAMSFPKDYEFSGNREAKVKQIGNAVPVNLSRAHCRALMA